MAMTVRTNVPSLRAAGQLGVTQLSLTRTLERISSGQRINRAADDAAGLGVATSLRTDVLSTQQAIRNSNDGISIITTAESATNEITDILQRMRELAIQSASGTLANEERSYVQDEFTELRLEVERIAAVTEFNGVALTDGSLSGLNVQVGIQNAASSIIRISLTDLTTVGLGISAMSLDTMANSLSALSVLDTALSSVNAHRSRLGAAQNRIDAAIDNSTVYIEALTSAESTIMDADYAVETSELTKLQILQQAGVAALAQAKNINQALISLLS
ncbi:MAG: flagellin FliC [Deltaproteobacteria bacterium]|jgi:flagellin|nr:flagellin FliC [Deltaproteobacteria bacterium]